MSVKQAIEQLQRLRDTLVAREPSLVLSLARVLWVLAIFDKANRKVRRVARGGAFERQIDSA